ncbi:hypothetical protein BGZ89_000395, partial [Linnemannia elongata]
MTHPLDLPEILIHVASFLNTRDRKSCLLVCKPWHQTFIPLIWENVYLWTYNRHQWPSIDAIDRHAHHITNLTYFSNPPLEYLSFPGLRQVRSLSLFYDGLPSGIMNSTYWDAATVIIRQNLALESLKLYDTWPTMDTAERFWDAVAGHAGIKEISVHGAMNLERPSGEMDRPDHGLWRICQSQLESLRLSHMSIPANPDALLLGDDIGTTFPRMKRLSHILVKDTIKPEDQNADILLRRFAGLPCLGQVRFLARCPNLQDLEMRFSYTHDCPRDAIVQRFAAGFWPLLTRVVLSVAGFTDKELAQITGSLGAAPVEELLVPESSFGYQTLAAFENQSLFRNIRKMDFYDSKVLGWAARESSAVVQTILERSPVLEDFTANYLLASDVAHGQEWVCTGMKRLKVDIIVDNGNKEEEKGKEKEMKKRRKELHVAVFERLDKLHQLDTLALLSRTLTSAVELESRMSLDLRHGLGLLENVLQLEVLSFSNQQVFEEEDVRWIKDHWKKLRQISRPLDADPERMRELDSAMYLSG